MAGDWKQKRKFKTYPTGYFHIDAAKVQTAKDKLRLFGDRSIGHRFGGHRK